MNIILVYLLIVIMAVGGFLQDTWAWFGSHLTCLLRVEEKDPIKQNNTTYNTDMNKNNSLLSPAAKKKSLSKEQIQQIHDSIRDRNRYPIVETNTRNVLIVGRTRTGKSTAIEVLKDPCYIAKGTTSLFSDTEDARYQSFTVHDGIEKTKSTLHIIDTPGLKEVKKINEVARSDEYILSAINHCLCNEVTKLNALLLFISFELGVTKDDIQAFNELIKNFAHSNVKIGICVTRSEDKPAEWNQMIEQQLHEHQFFSNLLKQTNVKLIFLGCLDKIKLNRSSCMKDVENMSKCIYRMRETLIKFILDSQDQVKLADLPFMLTLKDELRTKFTAQFEILDRLENVSNLNKERYDLISFARNRSCIEQNGAKIFLLDDDLYNQLQDMKARMKRVARRIPNDEMRSTFTGKLI
jgi:GTP-binding protein EngB required for normal cell division